MNEPDYAEGLRKGDTHALSKAITLIESRRPEDHHKGRQLLHSILPLTGRSIRIGVTGVPGVGKSTFIESLGRHVTRQGKKIAVLSIDPSSPITGGSILADKTRMVELSRNPRAYIRPSPAGDITGGVARHTQESILLCEAAGYEVIIVETLGAGQGDLAVKDIVDFFMLLILPGSGDEIQAIKRGIMEMADAIVISKADGTNIETARQAQAAFTNAVRSFPQAESGWQVPVFTCSAFENEGIAKAWDTIDAFMSHMRGQGLLERQRTRQRIRWFRQMLSQHLDARIEQDPQLRAKRVELEAAVAAYNMFPAEAADQLFEALMSGSPDINPKG